ncbi:MAG: rhomboid family intramembrane serine protease [bacterium]
MSDYWFERIIEKLEKRYRQFAIQNLTLYIVGLNAFVYVLWHVNPYYISLLTLNLDKILQGQIWRLFTYIFIPPSTNLFFIFFALYFLYLVGTALEAEWGTFRFNIYYLLGMISTTIVAVLFPESHITNIYLNTSLFLAFAALYPNFIVYLFLIIPMKMKYLGIISWIFICVNLIFGSMKVRLETAAGIVNFILFFGPYVIHNIKSMRRRKKFEATVAHAKSKSLHTCSICGKTEKDDPELTFRVCTRCSDGQEYCSEHLRNHEHR